MKPEQQCRVAGVALAALLGAGAFWSGLYAPGQQLIPTAVLAVLVLMERRPALFSRLEAAAFALLLAGAALSLVRPASMGNAAHGPLIAAGWLLAFALGRQWAGAGGDGVKAEWERLLGPIWAVAGCLMVFGSAAALSYLPAHHSGRLAGFLGYPIATGVLGLLGLAGALPMLAPGRWWAAAVACANAAAVLLSGSRGLWAAGVALAAYLLWSRPAMLHRVWLPLAGAVAAAVWAGPAVAGAQPWPAVTALSLACSTVGVLHWLQERMGFRLTAAAAGVIWLGAAATAPGWPWLLGRAAALPLTEGSSVERLTFLRDGLRMAAHLPLGAGFKAWAALHLQGASYSYYSAEVHSAPLDLALAFGWAGAAGFLLLLGRYLWHLREGRRWAPERLAVLGGAGALGLHALVDWDLSYGVFTTGLFLAMGLMGAQPGARPARVPGALTGAVASLALAGVVVLGAGDTAQMLADRAVAAGAPAAATQHAALATGVNPWNDMAWATLGQAYAAAGEREGALAAFDRARRLGPYEPWYAELQARQLIQAGRWREAAAAWQEYVRLWPWETAAYEEALDSLLDLSLRAALAGDAATGSDLAAAGRAILADLDRQKAKEPPNRPRKPMQTDTPVLRRAREAFGQGG